VRAFLRMLWRSAEDTMMDTTRVLPLRHAMCSGVSSCRVVAQTSAPFSSSTCTQRFRLVRGEGRGVST
jgi:hypothetical protein